MSARPIHMLPQVQNPPSLEDKRLAKLEDDLNAIRDAIWVLVIAMVALMVLVALVILGVI